MLFWVEDMGEGWAAGLSWDKNSSSLEDIPDSSLGLSRRIGVSVSISCLLLPAFGSVLTDFGGAYSTESRSIGSENVAMFSM